MSLPIGHGLVGIAIAKRTGISPLLAFILANLPDIDYFFGLFFAGGNMLAFHRSPLTHSPIFGVLIIVILLLWKKLQRGTYTLKQLVGVYLIATSHWLVDHIILPYQFDITTGTHGFWDFVFAHVISGEFFYNLLIDIAFYGALYVLIVKFIFKEKLY